MTLCHILDWSIAPVSYHIFYVLKCRKTQENKSCNYILKSIYNFSFLYFLINMVFYLSVIGLSNEKSSSRHSNTEFNIGLLVSDHVSTNL